MIARERLLDIAEEMMSKRGYAGTSVAEMVNAAGVGPPTLYWHFKNKQGILAAVMERGADRWLSGLHRWEDLPGVAPRERFIDALSAAARAIGDEPNFLRLLMLLALERGDHDEAIIAAIRSIRARSREWMIGLLRNAWPALPRVVAEDLAYKMMGFADGWCLRTIVEPERSNFSESEWLSGIIADEATAFVTRERRKLRVVSSRRSAGSLSLAQAGPMTATFNESGEEG